MNGYIQGKESTGCTVGFYFKFISGKSCIRGDLRFIGMMNDYSKGSSGMMNDLTMIFVPYC